MGGQRGDGGELGDRPRLCNCPVRVVPSFPRWVLGVIAGCSGIPLILGCTCAAGEVARLLTGCAVYPARLGAVGVHHLEHGLARSSPGGDELVDERSPRLEIGCCAIDSGDGAGESTQVGRQVVDVGGAVLGGDDAGGVEDSVAAGETKVVGGENGVVSCDDPGTHDGYEQFIRHEFRVAGRRAGRYM